MVIAAATIAILAILSAISAIATITAAVTVTAVAAANHRNVKKRAGENPACVFRSICEKYKKGMIPCVQSCLSTAFCTIAVSHGD